MTNEISLDQINKIIKKHPNYLFLVFLIILYFILDYQTILFSQPQGIHFIRQTDSLSFVANYFHNGFNFFQPQVFNLQSIDGKAACEFPILYYITAILYFIFDENEFSLRLISLTLASTGFYFLFKLLHSFLQDIVYALGFTFLFISSTVLLYYTNNFLPDVSAFGLSLIGWYLFFAFLKNRKRKNSLLAFLIFFVLASLIKVTYFINPIAAISTIYIYDLYNKKSIKETLKSNIAPSIYFISSLIIVISWNLYVINYNMINHDSYFLIQPNPIWDIDKNKINEVWDYITNYWYSKYYYESTFHVFLLIIIVGFIFIKKSEKTILIPALILTLGSTIYFMLFFVQFKDHDYYFITLIPAIILLVTNSFISIKNKFPKFTSHKIVKLIFIILCILSINYGREKLSERYKIDDDGFAKIGNTLSGTREYLDSLGVSQNAKTVIISDPSPNGGLYFINRPGWSLADTSEVNLTSLKNYINQGAEYIIFTNEDFIPSNVNGIKIGEHNGVLVYKTNRINQ